MELKDLRDQIDIIDNELVGLFKKRMELSAKIADYKKAHNMPIFVPAREQEILEAVVQKAGPNMSDYVTELYSLIFELSKSHQTKRSTAADRSVDF